MAGERSFSMGSGGGVGGSAIWPKGTSDLVRDLVGRLTCPRFDELRDPKGDQGSPGKGGRVAAGVSGRVSRPGLNGAYNDWVSSSRWPSLRECRPWCPNEGSNECVLRFFDPSVRTLPSSTVGSTPRKDASSRTSSQPNSLVRGAKRQSGCSRMADVDSPWSHVWRTAWNRPSRWSRWAGKAAAMRVR